MRKGDNKDLVSNRRATFNYEILETFETGIVLKGTEIKSLRENGGAMTDAYVRVIGDELWLIGFNIAPYRHGNVHNHEEKRDRKLLMHKREIAKLNEMTQEKGLALIPLSLYLKEGRAKVKLACARGKKVSDKRDTIKEREDKRAIDRSLKRYK